MRQPIKINKTNPNKGVLDYSYLWMHQLENMDL